MNRHSHTRVDTHRPLRHWAGPEDAASREQVGQTWLIPITQVKVMELLRLTWPHTGVLENVHSEEAERAALVSPLPIHKDA